jgi:YidC/Oxa1 family membrane protein insertase
MMRLYRENGVSPTGGCLPMFLQMPALIVLYDVIKGLANTVKIGTKLSSGRLCMTPLKFCATPRYIPHSSAMYKNLVASPGVIKSIGLNLATKPLGHHAHWYDYIPYIAMVLVAVALQYLQMAMMTRRNKRNANAPAVPQQMQTMQKFLPLIFAYIYLLVPAGVVIYMIVSSGIRVLTQDLMYRFGLVKLPGERKISPAKSATAKASTKSTAKASTKSTTSRRKEIEVQSSSSNGSGRNGSGPQRGSGSGGSRNGKKSTPAPIEPESKSHPRSRSKRERKAR